jgi:hypothetical protein
MSSAVAHWARSSRPQLAKINYFMIIARASERSINLQRSAGSNRKLMRLLPRRRRRAGWPTHPMIRELKGARKARIQRPGMGKRGGGRVVYYVALGTDRFYMMAASPKSERDDLSTEQRRRILVALESIKKPGS